VTNQIAPRIVALMALSVAALAPIQASGQSKVGVATTSPPPALVTTSADLDVKRESNKIKADEVALKAAELEFRKREAELARELEWWKALATLASVVVAILAVAAPVAVGVRSLTSQRRIASEQARVQFQMKAVDLVLQGSANSRQAKERARALVALFKSDWLPERFAQDFDHANFRIDAGSSLGRRIELVKLLATAEPAARPQILKDWYVINPGDWWFVDPLLLDLTPAERLTLEDAATRANRNDKWATERRGKPDWITGEPTLPEAVPRAPRGNTDEA
jgi:hypothetical protein